jgi:hypothetical protein
MSDGASAVRIVRAFAAEPADLFFAESVLKPYSRVLDTQAKSSAILDTMRDPKQSLCAVFGCVTFSRRGRERFEIAKLVCDALDEITEENPAFMSQEGAEELWFRYCDLAKAAGRKPQEQLERGPIQGTAEYAQELVNTRRMSISEAVFSSIKRSGQLEPFVNRLLDIRGFGPKGCSLLLRDLVAISGLEEKVSYADRLYMQPIDKWVRLAAPFFIPDLSDRDAADWILAGKISKHARMANISGIRLNMGITYLGLRAASPDAFLKMIKRLGSPQPRDGNSETVQGEIGLKGLDTITESMEHGP